MKLEVLGNEGRERGKEWMTEVPLDKKGQLNTTTKEKAIGGKEGPIKGYIL